MTEVQGREMTVNLQHAVRVEEDWLRELFPNDFREDVEKAVMDSTGRELTIEGDVSVQLFPWLAVEIGKATLGNAPGFGDEPFAELERAELSVQSWPLILERAVAVGTTEIDGLTLNLAVDEPRRSRVRKAEPLHVLDEEEGMSEPSPQVLEDQRQRLDLLTLALNELPPLCRESFLLRKLEGLSHNEIAAHLNISRSLVEKHIVNAMRHCRLRMRAWESS